MLVHTPSWSCSAQVPAEDNMESRPNSLPFLSNEQWPAFLHCRCAIERLVLLGSTFGAVVGNIIACGACTVPGSRGVSRAPAVLRGV